MARLKREKHWSPAATEDGVVERRPHCCRTPPKCPGTTCEEPSLAVGRLGLEDGHDHLEKSRDCRRAARGWGCVGDDWLPHPTTNHRSPGVGARKLAHCPAFHVRESAVPVVTVQEAPPNPTPSTGPTQNGSAENSMGPATGAIPPCDKPDGLGLSRIVQNDTTGGPRFGLIQHPQGYDFLGDKEVGQHGGRTQGPGRPVCKGDFLSDRGICTLASRDH